MNLDHLRRNEVLRDRLAAEYALGTLRGGARRRFENWLRQDALLRRTVAEWEDRLAPMAELASPAMPVPPPAHVWKHIERRLGLRAGAMPPGKRRLFDSLAFWRGLGMLSTALATVLLALMLLRPPVQQAPLPAYVATLTDDKAQPVMVVTGDAARRMLTVKVVAPQPLAADKSLELWAVARQGGVRSLGLVAADGSVTLPLPEYAEPGAAPVLAITLEPKGGSGNPTAATGPIVYKGAWLRV